MKEFQPKNGFANFWKRSAALFADTVLFYVFFIFAMPFLGDMIVIPLRDILYQLVTDAPSSAWITMILMFLALFLPIFLYWVLIPYFLNSTFGMMMLDMEIKNKNGEKASLFRLIIRPIAFIIAWSFPILFITIPLSRGKVFPHDWASGTVVINEEIKLF